MGHYLKLDREKIVDQNGKKVARGPALDTAAAFMARFRFADHVCVAGQAALSAGNVRFAYIDRQLGTTGAASEVLGAIDTFLVDLPSITPPYRPLVVAFKGPFALYPEEGHDLTWATLEAMNITDRQTYPLLPGVSENPTDEDFSFSWRSQQWFVNAGFPGHPRRSRNFITPTWIINLQENFDSLRTMNKFETIKTVNAEREIAYQGSTNPFLVDKGKGDQWKQVASIANQPTPPCPFHKG